MVSPYNLDYLIAVAISRLNQKGNSPLSDLLDEEECVADAAGHRLHVLPAQRLDQLRVGARLAVLS